jgi:hypothetical protein
MALLSRVIAFMLIQNSVAKKFITANPWTDFHNRLIGVGIFMDKVLGGWRVLWKDSQAFEKLSGCKK